MEYKNREILKDTHTHKYLLRLDSNTTYWERSDLPSKWSVVKNINVSTNITTFIYLVVKINVTPIFVSGILHYKIYIYFIVFKTIDSKQQTMWKESTICIKNKNISSNKIFLLHKYVSQNILKIWNTMKLCQEIPVMFKREIL